MREINHLSIHQWPRSAIPDSQQPTSPIGFLFVKLPPPPCAVLLEYQRGFLTICTVTCRDLKPTSFKLKIWGAWSQGHDGWSSDAGQFKLGLSQEKHAAVGYSLYIMIIIYKFCISSPYCRWPIQHDKLYYNLNYIMHNVDIYIYTYIRIYIHIYI